ncbi:4-(hydroxymethyl)-2-furancarboxaldehyde-phosphate synthase [uncultured Gammaproteobacteria bacterium]|jgi:uncharacterized protein (UPF0264 family)|nr:4-(hydroxymethyl)-2-furancarboxaldehyde-phosphate synthase [uncultured Gammaproteobacteria bacterium]
MNKMLASVNCLEEAMIVEQAQVDIIDLKQPSLGALGALELDVVSQIVNSPQLSKAISATVGDLPMQADTIFNAVEKMAATGVDYVKIGFFPEGNWLPIIQQLKSLTQANIKLIAVLFADQNPDLNTLKDFALAGFCGVMLDTMDKKNGSLTQVMPRQEIQNFVENSKKYKLLCGLAGSLRLQDIANLKPLQADYLGFRGALCNQHQRTSAIDQQALLAIRSAL